MPSGRSLWRSSNSIYADAPRKVPTTWRWPSATPCSIRTSSSTTSTSPTRAGAAKKRRSWSASWSPAPASASTTPRRWPSSCASSIPPGSSRLPAWRARSHRQRPHDPFVGCPRLVQAYFPGYGWVDFDRRAAPTRAPRPDPDRVSGRERHAEALEQRLWVRCPPQHPRHRCRPHGARSVAGPRRATRRVVHRDLHPARCRGRVAGGRRVAARSAAPCRPTMSMARWLASPGAWASVPADPDGL